MSSFLVRPATLADARAIAEIHASTDAPTAARKGAPQPAAGPGLERQQVFWREAVEYGEPQLLVACDGPSIIGFAGFDRSRDPGTPPTLGEIWFLQVRSDYWDRGAGLALWDALREGLVDEGCTQVSVWVGLLNERALRFLELAGFKREMSTARTTPAAGGGRVEEIRLKRKL